MAKETDRKKRRAAASAAALLTAASLTVGGLFRSPGDLLRRDADVPGPAYTDTLLTDDDDGDDGDTDELDTEEKLRRRGGARALLRERLLRLPVAVRLLVLLPLWCCGSGLMALGGAVWSGASPWLQGLLGFVLSAALLAGGFLLAARAVFPDLPLKKILKGRRTLPLLLLAALALTAADRILAAAWPEYGGVRQAIMACGYLLLLGSAVVGFTLREQRRRALLPAPAPAPLPEPAAPEKLYFTDPGGDFSISTKK